MSFNPKDHFFHKAKKEGFVARSAYKLQDIQRLHKILKANSRVLDLGCSPGSWSQVVLKIIGPKGFLLGVDLKPVEIPKTPNSEFLVEDILTMDLSRFGEQYDCVLSDMAPNTTGIRIQDQARSEELCRMVLKVAENHLKKGGNLAMKIFEGPDADQIAKDMKTQFRKTVRIKPEGVRKGSFETYLIGIGKL